MYCMRPSSLIRHGLIRQGENRGRYLTSVSVPDQNAVNQNEVPKPLEDTFHKSGRFSLEDVLLRTAHQAASLARKMKTEDYVEGQVLVKLKPGLGLQAQSEFLADYGAKVLYDFKFPPHMQSVFKGKLLQVALPEGLSTPQAIAAMEKDPRVAAVDSNDIVHIVSDDVRNIPDSVASDSGGDDKERMLQGDDDNNAPLPDDLDDRLWGLRNTGQGGGKPGVDIDAVGAWTVTRGSSSGPVIAVIDTGADYTHGDLQNNIWLNPSETEDGADDDNDGVIDDIHGYNAIDGSGDPMDDNGHGTHVTGTIAAEGNNGLGVVGVNWKARVLPVKFLSSSGGGTTADAIKALLYADQHGARITSNSWAGNKYNQILYDVLASSSALHVCAAGNEGYDNDIRPVYPASYKLPNIISVAAHDAKDRLARFSNRGKTVHLAAPGVDIYSTAPGDEYKIMSGTSMATPHVSGVAGLIATEYPEATALDIKRRILSSVTRMPEKYAVRLATGGRLNARMALEHDDVPPAIPGDFSGIAESPTRVKLAWITPGDDGMQGQAYSYDLRYSEFPIVVDKEAEPGQVTFDEAKSLKVFTPDVPGSRAEVKVDLAPSSDTRQMFFALAAVDNVGNRSPIAVTKVEVPADEGVAFEDTMDGDSKLRPEGSWGLVEVKGRGKVWTDSPEGKYREDIDQSLVSPVISLKDLKNTRLFIDIKNDVELKHDHLYIEVYGKRWWRRKWRKVADINGIDDWRTLAVDLSDYDGQDIKVRFRMKTDGSRNRDGVYLDNLVVAGTPSTPSKEAESG